MKNTHLTDESIQEFLLQKTQDHNVVAHLTVCTNCQNKMKNYQHLFDGIEKLDSDILPFDISIVVMEKIMIYDKKKNKNEALFTWGILTFMAIAIASMSIPFLPKMTNLFSSKSIHINLVIFGTFILVFTFLLVDIYQRYKTNEEKYLKTNCNR